MVEGSPRRVSVTSHEASIKMELSEEEEKPEPPSPHPKLHEILRKAESAPTGRNLMNSTGISRWKKIRTTVQIGSAVSAHCKKPPLKREDSFLQRFSTRPANAPIDTSKPSKILRLSTVLNPDESLLFCWLWVVTLCGLHNSWTLIVRQAFPELQERHPTLWSVLDGISDVAYLLDIVVQFRTGYLEQGIMVRDSARLAKHYLASKDFFLDVAALTPLDFMHGVVGDSPLLRFPRFLKARRIYKFYYAVESRTAYPNLWRVVNMVHVLLLLSHWFGCFYYMLSELEGFEGGWAYKHPEKENSPLVRKYLGSVYWSTLTLTTIGDLATPATNLQYLFTIISYLIGVFIFATIVGQVGNVITNRNASRLEFERLLDGAKLYMRHHKVPKGMQRRVQRWYDYSWSRGRMQGGGDIHSALGILPDKLKTELAIHVNLKTLKKVSIFQECQPEFLHDLVLKMKAYIFTPGDLICRKGEVAREMFIIADGLLEVINDKGQVLTQMKAGDFFGEIGILNLDGFNRRTADVRSVGYSELFSLSREDVLSAMKDYPEAEEILQSMGRKRLKEARKANNLSDSTDNKTGCFQEDGQREESDRGSNDGRQRKMGLSLAYLLKNKKDSGSFSDLEQKVSNVSCISEGPKISGNRNRRFVDLVHKLSLLRQGASDDDKITPKSDDSPGVNSIIERIIQNQNQVLPLQMKRKRSLWHKLSRFVHLRHWRTSNLEHVPEPSEPNLSYCSVLQKTETQGYQCAKRSMSPAERTSLQASRPSVSNWNRSELFTCSTEKDLVKKRRKTLSDSGTLLKTNLCQEKLAKKLPGILMTGSGLNVKNESTDISPMSSNYSLSPSTSENEGCDEAEDDEEEEEETSTTEAKEPALQNVDTTEIKNEKISPVTKVPAPALSPAAENIEQTIAKILCDFKATMDFYLAESEKEMCLRILDLEDEIKAKDAVINDLQQQVIDQLQNETAEVVEKEVEGEEEEEEEPVPEPSPQSSPPKKFSQDSAICSIDITTPSPQDTESAVHFAEEELWFIEFPQNAPSSHLSVKPPKLRRHSSVEVGHEVPFRLASRKSEDIFLRPKDIATSPRRFSESQARPDVVLNNSFAARVRRVFAKVKANRASEENSEDTSPSSTTPSKWSLLAAPKATRRSSTGSAIPDKQRYDDTMDRGCETIKRFLPTITESCSFDSLRESAMMEVKMPDDRSSTSSTENKDSVQIDMQGDAEDQST